MNYEIILYCGIVGSIITLVFTIVIFIRGNVLNLLKDLIGTRKFKDKNQESIKNRKVKTKNKKYVETEVISIEYKNNKSIPIKEMLAADRETEVIYQDTKVMNKYETSLLEETYLLGCDEEETSLLNNEEETSLLEYDEEETSLLNEEETSILVEDILGENDYIIEKNIMVINCELVI